MGFEWIHFDFQHIVSLLNSCFIVLGIDQPTSILPPGAFFVEIPGLCFSLACVHKLYTTWFTFALLIEIVYLTLRGSYEAIPRLLVLGTGALLSVLLLLLVFRSTDNIFELPVRILFYVVFATMMASSWSTCWSWTCREAYLLVSPALAMVAAVLYAMASVAGHSLVHSRILGGSGIEPMVTRLPRLPSDSDLAGLGRIRL